MTSPVCLVEEASLDKALSLALRDAPMISNIEIT